MAVFCIGVGIGISLGLGVLIWFIIGDHLKLNIPYNDQLDDDFTTHTKFWASLCIGDAEVEYLTEIGCKGDTFARLKIHTAHSNQLALAQLDDYSYRPRADYPWRPPLVVELRMRFSTQNDLGTAGFYLWNNPMGLGSEAPNLRPLKWIGVYRIAPEAQQDFSGQTDSFRASIANGRWRDILTFLGVPFAPKLQLKEVGLDKLHDWTQWHIYRIEWLTDKISIAIDNEVVLSYKTSITRSLSMVLWYDNNFPQITMKKIDLQMSAIDTPTWLDVDYIKAHSLI